LVPGEGYTRTVTVGAQFVVTLMPGGTNPATANRLLAFTMDKQGHVTQP